MRKLMYKLAYLILDFIFKSQQRIKIIIVLFVLLAALLLFSKYLIILFMIVLGAASMVHNIWTKNYVGFELCTLATVICGMYYGASAGATVGLISIVAGLILSVNLDAGLLISAVLFMLIGVFASLFSFSSIMAVGIISALAYDVIIIAFYYLAGSNPVSSASYFFTHQVLNYFVFKLIAPVFVGFIS